MKNQLPKTQKQQDAFTLIELLIAISIVAILSVIGFSIFQNIQKGARDSARRIEVDALAKNLEATFNPAVRAYAYSRDQYNNDFSSNHRPADPQVSGANTHNYCIRVDRFSTGIPATEPPLPTSAEWAYNAAAPGCPSGGGIGTYVPFTSKTAGYVDNLVRSGSADGSLLTDATNPFSWVGNSPTVGVNTTTLTNNIVWWRLCARLESTDGVYCKTSSQR